MANSYFSLEVGENLIKLADVKKSGNFLEINSLGFTQANQTFYHTDNEENLTTQANFIEKLVSANKISKKNVAVIIPDSFTYTQIITTPSLTEKELISAIKYQADQFIPMPIEETNIDVEILQKNEEGGEITVLMVAAQKKLIEKVQNLIEAAGLIPESVENELSSSARFLSEFKNLLPSKPEDKIILCNFSGNSTTLYLYQPHLSLITETYNFRVGYNLFLKEIQINTSLDFLRCQQLLKEYDPQQKTSYDLTPIITPVLREFVLEIKRFVNLLNEKDQIQINSLYFFNEILQFPAITFLVEKLLSIPSKQLNPTSICRPYPKIISYQNDLPLFISVFGGNLR